MKKIRSWSEICPEDDAVFDQPDSALETEVRQLRQNVLRELVCGSSGRYQVPKNILLIGQASAGKSSLVNLFKSALLGSYDQIAQPGAMTEGSDPQFTNRLIPYYNMGFTELQLLKVKQEFPKIDFPDDFQLPTITDMPGLQNRPHFLLDCILDGIVPEEAQLLDPLANERRPPVSFTNEDLAVDHVIFVSSVTQDVSVHLFRQAFDVASRQKGIPYFLIFTHSDQQEHLQAGRADLRRNESKKVLLISKNSKLLCHDVINYHDDEPTSQTDRSVYKIDLEKHRNALDAFLKIIKPRKRPRMSRMSGRSEVMQRYVSFRRNQNPSFFEGLYLVIAGMLLYIYQCISFPFTSLTSRRSCRVHQD